MASGHSSRSRIGGMTTKKKKEEGKYEKVRQMAQKKRKIKLKRKVWIEPEMFQSEVFRSLTKWQMWILMRFHQKRPWSEMKRGNETNRIYENGGLTFTYTEAEHFGFTGGTFYTAIKRLVELGFLDVEHRGGTFGHGQIKDYTRFKLVDRWKKWGTEDFIPRDFPKLQNEGADVQSRKAKKEIQES